MYYIQFANSFNKYLYILSLYLMPASHPALLSLAILIIFCIIPLGNAWCFRTSFNTSNQATHISFSKDQSFVVITSIPGKTATVYDATNYNVLFTYAPSGRVPQWAKFSKDGLYLGVGLDNGTVVLLQGFPTFTSTAVFVLNMNSTQAIVQLDFSSSGKLLICWNNFYRVYNNFSSNATFLPASITTPGSITSCKFTIDQQVVVNYGNKSIYAYDSVTYTTKNFVAAPANAAVTFDVRLSTSAPNKIALAFNNNSGITYLLSANNTISNNFNNSIQQVNDACYSGDGTYYAYVGKDTIVYVLNDNDTLDISFSNPSGTLKSCAFTNSGNTLLAGSLTPNSTVYVYQKYCMDCLTGQYFIAPSTCSQCSIVRYQCSSCTSATVCTSCYQGFYLNYTTHACQTCGILQGCSTCSNSTVCIECNTGYYLTGGNICSSCITAKAGCLSCSASSTCLICDLDYFLSGSNCSRCNSTMAGCLRCNSSSICIHCMMGYYQVSNSGCSLCSVNCLSCVVSSANCSSCVRGYYLNGTTCTLCSISLTYCHQCYNSTYCMDCKVGVFRNAGGNCNLCISPCLSCNVSGSTCYNCIVGYYFISSNNTCAVCSNNCSTCTTTTNCSTCIIGFYLVTSNNTCSPCKPNYPHCSSCSNTACFACDPGYYYNSGNSTCVLCNNNNQMFACVSCNSSSLCQACAVGFYLTLLTGNSSCAACGVGCESCFAASTNCSNCITGYYLSTTTACSPCISNCMTCNSSSYCFACNIGFYLSGTNTCCICASNLVNCMDCLNSTYCINCAVGTYLNPLNLGCSLCPAYCTTCNTSASCYSCGLGFYLNSTYSCNKCQQNCSQCTTQTNCFNCNVGYFFNSSLLTNQCQSCNLVSYGCQLCNSTACLSCQKGRFLNTSNLCQLCSISIPNCIDCTSNVLCSFCTFGFYLSPTSSTCTTCDGLSGCESCSSSSNCTNCKVGFYWMSNYTCTGCPSKCRTCSSSSLCISCAPSFILNATMPDCVTCDSYLQSCELCATTSVCVRCSSGYYLLGGACSNCRSSLGGCLFCNSSTVCVTCEDGYYLGATNKCLLCNVMGGCQICNSSSICLECENGYYLSGNSCLLCSSAMAGCIYCSGSVDCTSCQTGYFLASNLCNSCQNSIPGCIFCNASNYCSQCQSGYYVNSSNLCAPCSQKGCSICQSLNSSLCVSCNSQYYLTASNQCISCPIVGCLDCTSALNCYACQTGYYLSSSSNCILCSSSIMGCSKCSSSTICIECKSLYFLASNNTCQACSLAIPGCSFCTLSSSCSACSSGFYLNTTTNLCDLCSSLTGCLMCSNSSICLYCQIGFYLLSGFCNSCTSIPFCLNCINSTACSVCQSGYVLNTSSLCEAMKIGSGSSAIQPVTGLNWYTYYINQSTLMSVLEAKGMVYSQNNSNSINWNSSAKIYLETKPNSTLLNITGVQWGVDGSTLHFYTNNPLNLTTKDIPLIPSTTSSRRLLTGQSVSTGNSMTSLSLTQSALAQILPTFTHQGDLSMSYSLSQPQFYLSVLNQNSQFLYFVFGLSFTIFMLVMFFIKAICLIPQSHSHGDIMPHVFALKIIPLALYPVYGEYISFAYGFMTADLPWANQLIGKAFSTSSDNSPLGYLLFYQNMNIASMYLIALGVCILCLSLGYLAYRKRTPSLSPSINNRVVQPNKFSSFLYFIYNLFIFGLVFAGLSSLQGSISNPSNIISLNGAFYIIGIVTYILVLAELIYTIYQHNLQRFYKIRIIIKASLLSFAHYSPIYIVSAAIIIDLIGTILEYNFRKQGGLTSSNIILCPVAWIINQILVNLALGIFFYIPDSLIILYITAVVIFYVISSEVYMIYQEKNYGKQSSDMLHVNQSQAKKITSNSLNTSLHDIKWNISADDFSLEKGTQQKGDNNQLGETMYVESRDQLAETGIKKRNRRFKAENQAGANANVLKVHTIGKDKQPMSEVLDQGSW